MKENSKVLIRKKITDGSWFAVLAKGWRYDGSAVIGHVWFRIRL